MRICSSFGFGRNLVAPAIGRLIERYPELELRFEVLDRVVDPVKEGFDLDVRVGDEIAPHLVARRLADNYRVLCASPDYLKRRGIPESLGDLAKHSCLVIKERDHPFGTWDLQDGNNVTSVKVSGNLSTNHGEVAVRWAIDGFGILLRSIWNVGTMIENGQLARVLPDYRQDANIWAVYPAESKQSAKIRVCVEFLRQYFDRAEALSGKH
jgi:LysR family transcriptional activator of dmlA